MPNAPSPKSPTTVQDSKPPVLVRRARWEAGAMILMAACVLALFLRVRTQNAELKRMESEPLKAAMAQYRQEAGSLIQWNAKAPDFTASDYKGNVYQMRDLLRGSRYLALAFFGKRKDFLNVNNAKVTGDLMGIQERFGKKGVRIAAIFETPPSGVLPPWLPRMLKFALLRDKRHGVREGVRRYSVRFRRRSSWIMIRTESSPRKPASIRKADRRIFARRLRRSFRVMRRCLGPIRTR